MTPDGYPDDDELERIRKWDARDLLGLFAFLEERWRWPSYFHRAQRPYRKRLTFEISTGGWSGHEEMLSALEENRMAWIVSWWSVKRGGHYVFRIPTWSIGL